MARYVALLRAVNVGGRGPVRMPALAAVFASCGLGSVATLLQSGNVTFSARAGSAGALERRLEAVCRRDLGLTTSIMVRGSTAWATIVEGNPFVREAQNSPGFVVVAVLKTVVPRAAADRLLAHLPPGRERAALGAGALYISYPDGIGRSKLTSERIERALGTRVTMRNWNTVGRITKQLNGESA